VTDLKARVPERIENTINDTANLPVAVPVENHQINIRPGKKLLPAISTDCHKGHRTGIPPGQSSAKTVNKKSVNQCTVVTEEIHPPGKIPPEFLQSLIFIPEF
jgi:hypothetical protein